MPVGYAVHMSANPLSMVVNMPEARERPAERPAERESGTIRPRALVLEPQGLVREGLRILLEGEAGCDVTGLAATLDAAIGLARRLTLDLILIGLSRATCAGADPVVALLDAAPGARVLVVAGSADHEPRVAAMRAGAHGVIGLDRSTGDLIDAVRRVLAGGYALDAALVPHILAGPAPGRDPLKELTTRERQVVSLVCEGLRNKQVGARLSISEITVRHHLTSAYAKLDVRDRLELVLKLKSRG